MPDFKQEFQTAWLQLSSPCLWGGCQHSSATWVPWNLLTPSCTKNCGPFMETQDNSTDKGIEMYPNEAKASFSCKASIICSSILLGIHVIVLLMPPNGSEGNCKSPILVLSSEVMQVMIWLITLIAVCKISTKKYVKFPWILRTYWLCSFLLSVIHTAFDVHFLVTNNGHLRMQDYTDFLGLLASTCLFGISIRGKTGTVFDLPEWLS
ncbi:ABC transporter C family member 9 [Vitis vinifera]|uniref:ABC transporter C family member 9 n=1 Tax=Vitis vinifera TaxID=29760 RepID=A0A438CHF0_VITVI|nr:ABC transporter C family member 9 [Vitis vinifera]